MMLKPFRSALIALILFTLLTGVVYPLAVTALAQTLFPVQANGSLLEVEGQVVGSARIGQTTADPRYFWSRPSAVNYMQGSTPDALIPSGATNLGPTSAVLAAAVAEREAAFRAANNLPAAVPVPDDLLFASGSGLDPHISPAAARLQIERVAAARGLDRQIVADLVEAHVEPPQLGVFGEPRVNVLLLNLALNRLE